MRAAAALLLVSLWSAIAAAQTTDYRPENSDWNGLSSLAALAARERLELVPRSELDWAEVGRDDVVFLIWPGAPVEPAHVMTFLRNGGRLLIADDYGRAADVLARLGILREHAPVHAPRVHDQNEALPIAESWDDGHPLAAGVDELTTNHPASFRVDRGPDVVFGFGEGEVLVASGSVGDGRFVALADPSVLINAMMAFDGNVQFAANLMAFLRPNDGAPHRVFLLTQGFALTGEPPATRDDLRTRPINVWFREFGEFLDELNDWVATEQGLWGIGVVAATLFLVICAAMVLPSGRSRELDGKWTRAGSSDEHLDYERFVALYDDPRGAPSFAYPAGVLRERLEARLTEVTGVPDPLASPERDLLARVEVQAGPAAARALAVLRPMAAALPTRAQAQAAWSARAVGAREFEAVHDAVRAFEDAVVKPSGSQAP